MAWGVFISYRREDSADVTGRIYDHLVAAFGEAAVFKDVDSIPLGVDFRSHLQSVVGQCRAVLVVIGRDWVDSRSGDGRRRLESAEDFVRLEIEAALSRGVPVVPLLVQGATMPAPQDLPEPIRPLAFRQGTPIKRDPDFRADVERLVRGLRTHIEAPGDDRDGDALGEPIGSWARPLSKIDGTAGAAPPATAGNEAVATSRGAREVHVDVPGAWLYRSALEPEGEWSSITTPATVLALADERHRLRVDAQVIDEWLRPLRALATIPSLVQLDLRGCEAVTDAGLAEVSPLVSLEELHLTRCGKVTGAGLRSLAPLSLLRQLHLAYCDSIDDAALASLHAFPLLAVLDLEGCARLTDTGIASLRAVRALEVLDLSGCTGVGDEGLGHLRRLERLGAVRLDWCEKVGAQGVAALASLPALRHLSLGFHSRLGARHLSPLRAAKNLRSLDLRGDPGIDADAIEAIGSVAGLERLYLPWCPGIDRAALEVLGSMIALTLVDLRGCDRIEDDALEILARMPALAEVRLGGGHRLDPRALEKLRQKGLRVVTA